MKLLRPFTGTGAIFFPIGLPPQGTCEFSTTTCREHCYAVSDSLFDFEIRVPEHYKKEIYNYIIKKPVNEIISKIVDELDGLQTPILHWFGTGDCMMKDIEKISTVIDNVPNSIVQMGFTRNKELWKMYKDIFSFTA